MEINNTNPLKSVVVKAHPLTKETDKVLPPETLVVYNTGKGELHVLMTADGIEVTQWNGECIVSQSTVLIL